MKLAEVIESFVPGDWGDSEYSSTSPNDVYCIRGADIVPITNGQYDNIPRRYISERSIREKLLKEGDLVIEKSGGSPTQSTGRIIYISKELIESKNKVVCSNFCTAIRIKKSWNSLFIYYYWLLIYNSNILFNFEGKTSGIRNLQLETALSSIDIKEISIQEQDRIANALSSIDNKIRLNRSINHNLPTPGHSLKEVEVRLVA